MWPYLLFGIYVAVSWLMLPYAINFYYLLARSLRRQQHPTRQPPRSWPLVSVQLPLYNERYVARRLIRAVCALSYPRERLQIQVLDDSTDDTQEICQSLVEEYRRRGFWVEYVRRPSRVGYKAGALRHGFKLARGVFVAVFDADFVPPPNFLRDLLPYFTSPRIGLVQARWGHINETHSYLTGAEALGLDLHFLIEQRARSSSSLLMNFNGTAGIWRRECIADAGGWHDALAEDLDLSYRAQLRGWRFLFVPHVVCPAELPVQMQAAKRQQFRWAKGAIEVAVKLGNRLFFAPLPMWTKIQAWLHITRHIVHPLLVMQFSLLPVLMLSGFNVSPLTALLTQILLGPAVYLYALRRLWGPRWTRKLVSYLYLVVFATGVSLSNARATVEALFNRRSPFLRTPKFGAIARTDRWRSSRYALPFVNNTFGELLLGSYGVAGALIALFTRNYLLLPYILLATAGFLYVGLSTLLHVPKTSRNRASVGLTPAAPTLSLSMTLPGE